MKGIIRQILANDILPDEFPDTIQMMNGKGTF